MDEKKPQTEPQRPRQVPFLGEYDVTGMAVIPPVEPGKPIPNREKQ